MPLKDASRSIRSCKDAARSFINRLKIASKVMTPHTASKERDFAIRLPREMYSGWLVRAHFGFDSKFIWLSPSPCWHCLSWPCGLGGTRRAKQIPILHAFVTFLAIRCKCDADYAFFYSLYKSKRPEIEVCFNTDIAPALCTILRLLQFGPGL